MDLEDRVAKTMNVVMLVLVATAFVAATVFMVYQQAEIFRGLTPADRLRHWGGWAPPVLMVFACAAFAFRFLRRSGR